MAILYAFTAAFALAAAAPSKHAARAVNPTVKGTPTVLGLANDPTLNRDSCGSVRFSDRAFWTCRDTQRYTSNHEIDPGFFISTSASWTNFGSDGKPAILSNELGMYGNQNNKPFFTYLPEDCGSGGGCPDGTRYAIWPDSPPMVAQTAQDGTISAYTWIRRSHIKSDLSTVDADPPTTLYKITYNPKKNDPAHLDILPAVSIVKGAFWAEGEIPYGNYGNVVKDGTAYLYGQPSSGVVSLAKVPANAVEDITQYQYWVDGAWTKTKPSAKASSNSIGLPNSSAGGQGTYYYSDAWKSYVWIGGSKFPSADFSITTAPNPQGPWEQPKSFYKGQNGNFSLGAYSLQANPSLVQAGKNEIYLTYTKNDLGADGKTSFYTTPLIHVEWQ